MVTYNSKERKKAHKEEAKADVETEEEQRAAVVLVTHVNNILHSYFPNLRCSSTISKFTTLMNRMRTIHTFRTTSGDPSQNTRKFCSAKGTIKKNLLVKLWTHPWLNLSHKENENS